MLEFSFCGTGRREGRSVRKGEGRALGNKRVLGTGWQWRSLGQGDPRWADSWQKGSRAVWWEPDEGSEKARWKSLGVPAEGPSHPPELQDLHPPGAHCHGSFVLVGSCSFCLSLGLGSGAELITQQTQIGERRVISPVVKARVCHYTWKMWWTHSQTEGSWTQQQRTRLFQPGLKQFREKHIWGHEKAVFVYFLEIWLCLGKLNCQ